MRRGIIVHYSPEIAQSECLSVRVTFSLNFINAKYKTWGVEGCA